MANPATDDFLLANPSLNYTNLGEGGFLRTLRPRSVRRVISRSTRACGTAGPALRSASSSAQGNQPDEWFVYLLDPLVSSGDWSFVNLFGTGGGLSHVQLYGVERGTSVPEPGTLGLFGSR
jgi:hypothetical protein